MTTNERTKQFIKDAYAVETATKEFYNKTLATCSKATKDYANLSIHQRINYKSGWDVAAPNEHERNRFYKAVTTAGANAIRMSSYPYNIDRFYISLRTKYGQL